MLTTEAFVAVLALQLRKCQDPTSIGRDKVLVVEEPCFPHRCHECRVSYQFTTHHVRGLVSCLHSVRPRRVHLPSLPFPRSTLRPPTRYPQLGQLGARSECGQLRQGLGRHRRSVASPYVRVCSPQSSRHAAPVPGVHQQFLGGLQQSVHVGVEHTVHPHPKVPLISNQKKSAGVFAQSAGPAHTVHQSTVEALHLRPRVRNYRHGVPHRRPHDLFHQLHLLSHGTTTPSDHLCLLAYLRECRPSLVAPVQF
eukprot:1191349-Prorocentrum_minimum.AAC.2